MTIKETNENLPESPNCKKHENEELQWQILEMDDSKNLDYEVVSV